MTKSSKKLPFRLCIVSQWRFENLEKMPGKPISEATRMSREIERIVFVCYNEQGEYLSRKVNDNLYVYTVPLLMSNSLISTLKNMLTQFVSMFTFLSKIMRIHDIDFIRAENIILGGIPAFFTSMVTSVKYAIWMAGFEDQVIRIRYGTGIISSGVQLLFTLLKSTILSRAEYAVGVSSELLRENQRYTKGPSIVTPNFVDFEIFLPKQEYLKEPDKIRFVYIGRLESEKGIAILLETLDMLKDREDFVFRIVGWGTFLPEILSATRKGLHVVYWGKVSHDEIPGIIADSDVLVLPSLTEGMPAVILESLASGTPVIASSVGQIPIVVQDGIEGILTTPGDPKSLHDAIVKILDNKDIVSVLGKSARSRVEKISGGYVRIHRRLYQRFVPKLVKTK